MGSMRKHSDLQKKRELSNHCWLEIKGDLSDMTLEVNLTILKEYYRKMYMKLVTCYLVNSNIDFKPKRFHLLYMTLQLKKIGESCFKDDLNASELNTVATSS